MKRKYNFMDLMREAIQPSLCLCGTEYKEEQGEKGGFCTNGVTHIWCCSRGCADKTINKLY